MKNHTTSAQRLAKARAQAAHYLAARPDWVAYHDWRTHVARPFRGRPASGRWDSDTGLASGRPFYTDSLDAMGWRVVGDAADVLRGAGRWRAAQSCAWYADNFQHATITAAVLQLPARDGTPRYIPATYCSEWAGATAWPLDCHEDPESAASAAAGYAEREAESSREYCARDQAAQQIEEKREEIHSVNAAALALIREIKAAGRAFSPAVCAALRESLAGMLEERRAAFARIEALQSDPWQSVAGY